MIPVTKPFLPPFEEYEEYLKGIWKRQWLTNMGPLSNELEVRLMDYLKVKNLLFVANGTVALQMAIKVLELKGEIITTPFSFVSTTSSIVWEGCTPVFADIDSKSLNIDPAEIEKCVTPKTSAILATHVYGNPCDVTAIENIATKHKLKVIYDGAHAFGVKINGRSIFDYGDISICSLHATKLFHSSEGGLTIAKDKSILKKLVYARNFGYETTESFSALGINGKNSEFHAAMGLTNLKYLDRIHEQRKSLTNRYKRKLAKVKGYFPLWNKEATENYAYFPLVFDSHELAMKCLRLLQIHDVHARRYFFPSLANALPYLPSCSMPITDEVAPKVLCLPLYYDLSIEEVDFISNLVLRAQNHLE